LAYEDTAKFKGLVVGITRVIYEASGMRDYLSELGIPSSHLHIYDTQKACLQGLDEEETDAVMIDVKAVTNQYKILARCGYTGNYFACCENSDVVRKVDDIIGKIKVEEPAYLNNLYATYFSRFDREPITKKEAAYMKNVQKLSFGISNAQGYYARQNDRGEKKGIYPAVVRELCQRLGVECEIYTVLPREFENWAHPKKQISGSIWGNSKLKKIDVWVDCVKKQEDLEKRGIQLTKAPFYHDYYLVNRKGEEVNVAKDCCALIRGYEVSNEIRKMIKSDNILWCNDYEDCMKRVRQGEAKFSLVDTLAVEYYLPYYKNSNLSSVLVNYQSKSYMATRDKRLSSVINKVLIEMNEDGRMQEIFDEELLHSPKQNGFIGNIYNNPEQSINNLITMMVLLFIIVTLLVILFRVRKKNEFLEKVSAAKTDFMSRMSHDIRTPMNAVLGMTHLAKEEPDLSPRVSEYLEKIEGAGEYLLGLINDILDMTKLSSGAVVFKEECVDIREVKDSLTEMFGAQLMEKGITLQCDFSGVEDCYVIADRMRMKQIFSNLIGNALKFSAEGATIRWTCSTTRLGANQLRVTNVISDEGCGMSEEFLKRMFEPFEQEENAMSQSEMGTGLGLSIVKNLVEQLRGTIEVNSKLGEGTTFTLCFIRERGEAIFKNQERISSEEENGLNNVHVLVVEDQPLNQEIVKGILTKQNIRVSLVSNGAEAVEFMKSQKGEEISLILMDIRMPVMNGVEAARQIRSLPGEYAKSVPIIALTANAFEEDREMTKEAGMNGHLAKPIHPKELFETMEKFIKRS
jgi:signal transduction histidine kinase/ActR/RegA family two-component response regulator